MPGENRTHNSALGGHGYIHLTTDTYSILQDIAIPALANFFRRGHQIGHQILF